MRRSVLVRAAAAALFVAGAWAAYTQTPRPPAAEKVKDGLYMITGGGGNVAAYVTGEGVILVDDMYERNYEDVMSQVRRITDQPVRYVLNTHQHDDHAGSNARMLGAGVEVVAHRNARANMARLGQSGQPRLTFADQFAIHLGGKEVRAYHFGRGHTSGDAIVLFVEARTIHTGDIFLTRPALPFIDYANGGSAVEWTQVIDGIATLDFDTIIPGHGPVSDRAGLAAWRASFVKMRDRVRDQVRAGVGKEAVSRTLVEEFGWPANGLAIQQVDAFIEEMAQAF
jgi:cyclase